MSVFISAKASTERAKASGRNMLGHRVAKEGKDQELSDVFKIKLVLHGPARTLVLLSLGIEIKTNFSEHLFSFLNHFAILE
jgi:hypothetical protein